MKLRTQAELDEKLGLTVSPDGQRHWPQTVEGEPIRQESKVQERVYVEAQRHGRTFLLAITYTVPEDPTQPDDLEQRLTQGCAFWESRGFSLAAPGSVRERLDAPAVAPSVPTYPPPVIAAPVGSGPLTSCPIHGTANLRANQKYGGLECGAVSNTPPGRPFTKTRGPEAGMTVYYCEWRAQ